MVFLNVITYYLFYMCLLFLMLFVYFPYVSTLYA
jgi:hypothetical protein